MSTIPAKPALEYQRERLDVVGNTARIFWTTRPTISAKRPNFFRTKTIKPQITTENRNVDTGYSPPLLVPAARSTTTSAAIQSRLRAKRRRKRKKKTSRE